MRIPALAACLLSSVRSLAIATHTTIQSSQNHETAARYDTAHSLINRLSDAFRRRYLHGVDGRFVVLQLAALCGLLGVYSLWRKQRTSGQGKAERRSPVAGTMKGIDKGASAALAKTKGSFVEDVQLTDPGLLRKHSSLRSYTTSFGEYPAIRIFKREHPQADKLPNKPTPLPLLVFIHGLGGSLSQFHPLLTSLVNVAPCLGIDLPGCGLSSFSPTSWNAYSQEALVELLAMIIAESCSDNIDQGVVLIGHSMGCSLAALLATARSSFKTKQLNVLGLVAICPKVVPPTDRQLALFGKVLSLPTPILDLWRCWDRRGGPESASVARLVGPGANAETKKLQERFNVQSKSAVWRRIAWGLYNEQSNYTGQGGRMAGVETWGQLTVPVFLIAGESDRVTSPTEVTAISRALCNREPPSSEGFSNSIKSSGSQSRDGPESANWVDKALTASPGDIVEPNTKTTNLGKYQQASVSGMNPSSISSKRPQVLKTTVLPEPAAHSLLYDPRTFRTLAGLIQKFLWDHIDSRLSLGWQLQHLTTEGKWDVKNLVKWQAVKPVSEPIAGIFRAMKTLREIDDAHSPEIFTAHWKGKIKAVIDISHESPVYDPRGLDNGGIEYHKFPTVSKIPPTADEVQDFVKLVDSIRQTVSPTASTNASIGVHCHYGFNRTGFFICSYLIEKEHYSVQQAIDEFRAQRPPGIRHEHFLDTLFVRYCVGLKRIPIM